MSNFHNKFGAGIMALSAAVALAACSSEEEEATPTSEAPATSSVAAPTAELPTAADLNAVLAKATDPNVPVEEKTLTVQGSETAPELFETMTRSKQESGATFEVVDPVLPGPDPANTVSATVNFTVPGQEPQTAEAVEFVNEDGNWKLQQSWACTLIVNTVTPEEVPEMCSAQAQGGA
ncbi:hypothetical protein CENDO_07550 [Corynebacterium endometrii]|uniref:Low molecular weight antigen MTB12-like C-terminal domain-containing protein n=2 Tax=Corynebacterium endometrii TaxID=2488819 RepID=A0A4P7QIP9_9CORY|nr:hypothetical protein CENDO_07550 [Corynebacterium endometrii]